VFHPMKQSKAMAATADKVRKEKRRSAGRGNRFSNI